MTTQPITLLRTFVASLRYTREQTRREREARRRQARHVDRETQVRGERAVRETMEAGQ